MLRRLGYPEHIAEAFGEIPREIFVHSDVGDAYTDRAVLSYKGSDFYSTSSQPSLMAEFMRSVDLKSGMKVLEIGGGTGYNAAVMSRIVGSDGIVVSVEYEKELCEIAKENLKKLSIENVVLMNGDGYFGYPELAPYDVIFVAVGIDEIPTHWFDQLSDGGSIIAPMNLKSVNFYQPSILFRKSGNFLIGIYKSATSFIKASGMLGNLNERLLENLKKCGNYSEEIRMDISSMPILEIVTSSIGKVGSEYFFADGDCSALYKDNEWLFCGECTRLKSAVEALGEARFPDLMSSRFGFSRKKDEFLVERLY